MHIINLNKRTTLHFIQRKIYHTNKVRETKAGDRNRRGIKEEGL